MPNIVINVSLSLSDKRLSPLCVNADSRPRGAQTPERRNSQRVRGPGGYPDPPPNKTLRCALIPFSSKPWRQPTRHGTSERSAAESRPRAATGVQPRHPGRCPEHGTRAHAAARCRFSPLRPCLQLRPARAGVASPAPGTLFTPIFSAFSAPRK